MSTPSGPVPGFEPPADPAGPPARPAAPPAYPMAPAATPDRAPRPAVVTAAFWLILGGAVWFVVGAAATLVANMDDLERQARQSLAEDGEPFTDGEVQSLARVMAFMFTALAAMIAAPYVVFAPLMRGGRNWARVTLTVLVSIGGFITLLMIIAPLGIGTRMAEVALVAVAVVSVVLLFHPTADAYFHRPAPPPAWYPTPPGTHWQPGMRG